jgi:serine phosphatase RsbU (regulator of sigma subunit)
LKKKLILLLNILFITLSFAQNSSSYGKFYGKYFSQKDFQSGTQIWTGVQEKDGVVLFGNNNEILSFNGLSWKILKINGKNLAKAKIASVEKTKVTKLFKASNGKTYVGRENNFGEITYTEAGELSYKPLFISSTNDLCGEIWNIFEFKNELFFIAEKGVFVLKSNQVEKLSIPNTNGYTCMTAGAFDKGVLLTYRKDLDNEIERKYVYLNCATKKSYSQEISENIDFLNIRATEKKERHWNIFNFNGNVHRIKEENNRLIWLKDKPEEFKSIRGIEIYTVYKKNQIYYICTEGQGIHVLNEKTELIRRFDTHDGMENLIAYDVFLDNENNLWTCLSNGIHFFETSSPITYFNKKEGLTGENFSFDKFGNNITVGTQLDIWKAEKENDRIIFKSMNLIPEEIFQLQSFETDFGKKTLAVAYSGIYEINYNSKKTSKIIEELAWNCYQNPLNKNEFFVGNEGSLGKLILSESGWNYQVIIPDINGEIINMTHRNGNIYFGVRNSGIYELSIKTNTYKKLKFKNSKQNLNTNFYAGNYKDQVFFAMESGLFVLNKDNVVEPFKAFNNKFQGNKDFQIHRLFKENEDKFWVFIWDGKKAEHGYLEFKNNRWNWTSWPFESMNSYLVPLASTMMKISENEYWFTNGNEILSYNQKALPSIKKNYKISIEGIYLNDKLRIYNPHHALKLDAIPYSNNSIRIEFRANTYMAFDKLKYRYKLENYIDEWSEWSAFNFADYKKLGEGTYTLKIQAKNIYGFESEVESYTFTILPPWYRTWWAYFLYFITFIFLIYFIIKLSVQRVKNQNIKLEEIVEERTSEIAEQNKKLEIQKQEIEHKTQDIVDSIIYAKRIQETILPDERLARMFDDYCVFYRPKDIVSGDFYWARQKGDLSIFSAIDCTGHGVPGALVSIVGNASLLRCVNEHKLTEPAEILDKHREIVVKSFVTKTQTDVKDGMDMSLCVLDRKTLILKYAGANNECVIIRNKEIIELKPDKQPIGQFSHAFPFTQQEIQLQKGDCIFQYTDGYVDQFGGEKGKKLKSRPFKEYLVEISHLPMKEQYVKIQAFFDTWIQDYDQIDDVCVFGVKL